MRTIQEVVLCCTGALLLGLLPAHGQANWEVKKTMHIGGAGNWDYLTVDSASHRLFVPRTTHTMIIDSVSGKVLGDIPGQKNAHGVAIVPALGRGFITDGGGDGAIVIFDLNSYQVLGKITSVPDSDGILYDAELDRVLFVSGDKSLLMSFKPDIDPVNGRIDTSINLGGAPEFLASDGTGKVFINLEDKDEVAVVDLNSKSVVARWPVTPGGHPVGMSLDAKTHRLFLGCRNPQKMIVMSADNGKVLAALPIGAGVDATLVEDGQVFASCRDGSLTIASQKSGAYAVDQTVKTSVGARTMSIDPKTHILYLPTAEYEESKTGPNLGKLKQKPDSFLIMTVGEK